MRNFSTIKHFLSAAAVAFFIFLAFGSDDDKKKETSTINTENKKEETEKSPEEITETLETQIARFKEPFDNSSYNGDPESLRREILLFAAWARMVRDGEKSDLPRNNVLAAELKTNLSKLQAQELPILRKKYGEILANKLWEFDIIIQTSGSDHSTLNLTGASFATNKNIKDYQTTLNDGLKMFRFKQTRYRWYKGQDDFTYFDMKNPADTELMTFD